MPPVSNIEIAIKTLQRLIKEEKSYHSEVEMQEQRIESLKQQGVEGDSKKQGVEEDEDGSNFEFLMKQEQTALEETKKVFPRLRRAIADGARNLQSFLESPPQGTEQDEADVKAANDILDKAKPFME